MVRVTVGFSWTLNGFPSTPPPPHSEFLVDGRRDFSATRITCDRLLSEPPTDGLKFEAPVERRYLVTWSSWFIFTLKNFHFLFFEGEFLDFWGLKYRMMKPGVDFYWYRQGSLSNCLIVSTTKRGHVQLTVHFTRFHFSEKSIIYISLYNSIAGDVIKLQRPFNFHCVAIRPSCLCCNFQSLTTISWFKRNFQSENHSFWLVL